MTDIRDVARNVTGRLGQYQKKLLTFPALLGDGQGNVEVAGRTGYVYVRVGHEENVGRVFNDRVPLRENLDVIVGFDAVQPDLYQVLGQRRVHLQTNQTVIPNVGPHHITHEWPAIGDADSDGSDLVYVAWRQVRELRISATSGLEIECGRGPIYRDGTGWSWIAEQTLDLTASKPTGSQARFVLIYLDEDGTLASRDGTALAMGSITFSDVPAVYEGEMALAAVMLYSGQTSISDDRDEQNIIDLRWPQAYPAKSDRSDLNIGTDSELTISSGAITRTQTYHAVDTEGDAASDYLDTISGMSEGDVIVIHPASDDRDVIVRHDVDNIWLIEGENITLSGTGDHLMLVHDGTHVATVGGGGGSGSGTDVTAIHDNVANEIYQVAEKTTPVDADVLLAEDSADSWNKKRLTVGDLLAAASYYEPLADGSTIGPELIFTADGDVIMVEVSA